LAAQDDLRRRRHRRQEHEQDELALGARCERRRAFREDAFAGPLHAHLDPGRLSLDAGCDGERLVERDAGLRLDEAGCPNPGRLFGDGGVHRPTEG
jgi:hypothetical protein